MKGKLFLQGNIACAEGAIAAGMRFFAGYPITPSTGWQRDFQSSIVFTSRWRMK